MCNVIKIYLNEACMQLNKFLFQILIPHINKIFTNSGTYGKKDCFNPWYDFPRHLNVAMWLHTGMKLYTFSLQNKTLK